jgi:predicted RNA-binding Zn-ribbon protein involved in translation (DUF1610 family)
MRKLKSLEENNKEVTNLFYKLNDNSPRPNGIACPECGEELLDSEPNVVLLSNPVRYNIHCPKCGYAGYRN